LAEADVWRVLAEETAAGRRCALLAVVASRGSSPGRDGAVMAAGPARPLAGTVGGGLGEWMAVERAMAMLRTGEQASVLLSQQHRPGTDTSSGMICGGEQRIAIAPCGPAQRAGLAALAEALAAGRRLAWRLSPAGWTLAGADVTPGLVEAGDDWRYEHLAGPEYRVFLIGGGHVGRALSRLLVPLGFQVTVVEERPGIAADPRAHETYRWPYETLGERIPAGPEVFVAVMSHSPERDLAAIDALMGLRLGYLGLLGSRGKLEKLLSGRYRPDFWHAPMGLPINSHTPEEIAVSIAAEMISARNAGIP
jgi:xanthine dehydrogenase accessory factor